MSDIVIGQQTFDGLGRQRSVTVCGRRTGFTYVSGQLPVSANTLSDGREISFDYVHALDDLIREIRPANEPVHTFSYHPKLGVLESARGPLGEKSTTFSTGGLRISDTWDVDAAEHVTTWRQSLAGVLLGFVDSGNVDHQRDIDRFGRLVRIEAGAVSCAITYNDFSLPASYTTTDKSSGSKLVQTICYDSLNREHTRTFVSTLAGVNRTQRQTLTYTDLDQVHTRRWEEDTRQGEETFTYDLLGRLRSYTADSAIAPVDPFGNRVVKQVFSLNVLDGYKTVVSTFADGTHDVASFNYDNSEDPCQVSSITHTHESWPRLIKLNYDACGRLQSDSLGRTLSWDAQDRLVRVDYKGSSCIYGYDPSGNLCDRTVDNQLTRSFHSDGQVTHEQSGEEVLRLLGDAGQLFAIGRVTAGVQQGNATLLGCDAQGSVRIELDNGVRSRHYTAHGAEQSTEQDNPYGFAGERREPLTEWYIAGGNRPYDPLLMTFIAADSQSPFGRGGINPYSYCAGDPVNRIDPDGHAWWAWLLAGAGMLIGAAVTIASFGVGAPAGAAIAGLSSTGLAGLTVSGAAAIGSAVLGVASLATGAAAMVIEGGFNDTKTASILGWVSFGLGVASAALHLAPRAASAAAKAGRTIGRGSSITSKATSPTSLPNRGVAQPPAQPVNNEIAFLPNHDGHRSPVFVTHGGTDGTLMDMSGAMISPEELATTVIAPQIEEFALAGKTDIDRPLLLLACYAGESGAAQRVSDTLGMRVIAPMGELTVGNFDAAVEAMIQGLPYRNVSTPYSSLPGKLQSALPPKDRVDPVWNIFLPRKP
ncbi:RHS repeat domain-containing protein [Pseudomonas shirazensis]|uniref:RHS repeat domain-containing protein n=1 Tax=Pseudomonas shirazensis TaxID=2745494 RepID=UPI003D27D3E9